MGVLLDGVEADVVAVGVAQPGRIQPMRDGTTTPRFPHLAVSLLRRSASIGSGLPPKTG
jgi:hypothetical protein